MEKNYLKTVEKKKTNSLGELSERLIKEVAKRIGRVSANNPIDKATEAMRGIF